MDRCLHGEIIGTNARWVFVKYRGDSGSKATDPADLSFLTEGMRGDARITLFDDDGSVVANDREEAREARRHADEPEQPQHRHGCRRDETCGCEGE